MGKGSVQNNKHGPRQYDDLLLTGGNPFSPQLSPLVQKNRMLSNGSAVLDPRLLAEPERQGELSLPPDWRSRPLGDEYGHLTVRQVIVLEISWNNLAVNGTAPFGRLSDSQREELCREAGLSLAVARMWWRER